MSDNKIGSLVWEASLDADGFVKGEKATNDAQERIINKAKEADAALKQTNKTQQESINELNEALKNSAEEQSKTTQKTTAERRQAMAEEKADFQQSLAEKKAQQQEERQAAQIEQGNRRQDRLDEQFQYRQQRDEERDHHRERITNLQDFGRVALGVFGLVTGVRAVASAYSDITEGDASRYRMASRTGASAGGINALENAGELYSGPGGRSDADSTIENLAGIRRELKTFGTSSRLPAFNRLGISLMRNGRFLSPDELIDAAHTATLGKDQDRSRELLGQAGFAPQTVDLILSGDYDRLRAKGLANSNVTDANAATAQGRQEAGTNREQTQTEAFRSAVDKFGNAVSTFDNVISAVATWLTGHPGVTAAGLAAGAIGAGGLTLGKLWGIAKSFGGKAAAVGEEVAPVVAEGAEAAASLSVLPEIVAGASLFIPTSTANEGQNTRNTANAYIDYLVKKGWSRTAAAGMVANIYAESSFNPAAMQAGGGGIGLAQWTDRGRKARIEKYLGKSITSATAEEQLNAIDWEARHFYGGLFNKAQGADAATAGGLLSRGYEAPAAADSAARYRSGLANKFYGGNSQSSTVNINSINVHTNSADPKAHAQKISEVLRNNVTMAQASRGLA